MTVYKRDGSKFWQYEFQHQGKPYRGSCKTTNRREADAVEAEKKREAVLDAQAGLDGIRKVTLGDLTSEWLRSIQVEKGRDYRNDCSRVRKLFGEEAEYRKGQPTLIRTGVRAGLDRDLEWHKLTMGHLSDLKLSRIDEGNSPSTWNHEVALVQALQRFAGTRSYLMPKLPAMKDLRYKAGDGKLRYLSLAEERRLLDELRLRVECRGGHAAQDNLDLVVALLDTGGRYNEVATLRWTQVDFDTGMIDLDRLKGGRGINPMMTERLRAVLARRKLACGTRRYVFPSLQGKAWTFDDGHRGYAVTGIREAMDSVGLNADANVIEREGYATVHTFRDTFASRLVQNGAQLYTVQRLLGHSSPVMTQKYAKLAPDTAAQDAAAILTRVAQPAPVVALAVAA